MFQRSPDAERKIPTTVKLTHRQRRRAEERARELGMKPHAFYKMAILKASRPSRRQAMKAADGQCEGK